MLLVPKVSALDRFHCIHFEMYVFLILHKEDKKDIAKTVALILSCYESYIDGSKIENIIIEFQH